MLAFHIGLEEVEYVRVTLLADNGDGWFSSEVEVIAGGFAGRFAASFNSQAFLTFRDQLTRMLETLSGSAVFSSWEEQLELTLTCNALGHVHVKGVAMDAAGIGNALHFHFDIDQSYLPKILQDLRSAFP